MQNRKSRFLAFVFSFFPGAGHMYLGFMKMGLSLMAEFLFVVFIANVLHIGPILYISLLIWCYAFFDCLNKCHLSDDELFNIEDRYLLNSNDIFKFDNNILNKRKLILGIVILVLGIYALWNTFMNILQEIIPQEIFDFISNTSRTIPQILISVVIIIVGIKLIIGKKRESDNDD
ncbi:hypothetical protein ACJDT4_02850 [Clostridium neuense]|uniref:TM2 domain-containing protein n=1 Tax=Clostridium neuense TaxID=1728934 RepID=A0ABW8TAF6_9CLOT